MKPRMGKIIKAITPPLVWNAVRTFVTPQAKQYSGNYKSWDETLALTDGYDTALILEKVKTAALKVKQGLAAYERDSVNFSRVEYSWPLLAGLLWIASQNQNRLSLIDFGGSLGSSYYQNLKFIKHLTTLNWCVVEQKHFAEFGLKHLADEHLKFSDNLAQCASEQKPDAVLLSSVLPYLPKPYEILHLVANEIQPSYILIDRTPFLPAETPDRITVQQSSRKIYDASYPAWFLNEKKFRDFIGVNYELIEEWKALAGKIDLGDAVAEDKGFIFKRIERRETVFTFSSERSAGNKKSPAARRKVKGERLGERDSGAEA